MTRKPDSKNDDFQRTILLESGTNEVEFLQFLVAGQRYGINVSKVRQILTFTQDMITPLPNGGRSVVGITYFRGKPCPVINLREQLEVDAKEQPAERPLLIMTVINQITVGFLIDQVYEIIRASWDEFNPLEAAVFDSSTKNVLGCVTRGEQLILILDFESMLAELIPSTSIEHCADQVTEKTDKSRSDVCIVYCEDSTIVQKLMLATLSKAGFDKVKLFENGQEGLRYLATEGHERVDIILSDIEMPKLDGLSLCKEVRNLPAYKETPLIFFSSMISEEMKSKCKSVGGTDAFSKPEIHKIVALIDSLHIKQK